MKSLDSEKGKGAWKRLAGSPEIPYNSPNNKSDKSNISSFRLQPLDTQSGKSAHSPLPTIFDVAEPPHFEQQLPGRKVRTPTEKISMFKNCQVGSTMNSAADRFFRSVKSTQVPYQDVEHSNSQQSKLAFKEYFYGQPPHDDSFSFDFRNTRKSAHYDPVIIAERNSAQIEYDLRESPMQTYKDSKDQAASKKPDTQFKKAGLNLKETTSTLSTVKMAHKKSGQTLPKTLKAKETLYSPLCSSKLSACDFSKIKHMGKGRFGNVYMVRHKATGFLAALKVISKRQIIEEKLINQLIRELKIHAYLNHPNIIDFYGSFQDKQNIYILLQLGSEGQLYTKLKQKETYSQEATAFIVKNLLEAVQYMHQRKLLHRDIKPQNIVVVHGTVKLCDFGWAVYRGSDLRTTFCGTPLYLSPEVMLGLPYGQLADLWAIGILTYELMIGTIPFSITKQQELQKIITEQVRFPPGIDLSEEYKDFVTSILEKDLKKRLYCQHLLRHPFIEKYKDFQTCQELCQNQ